MEYDQIYQNDAVWGKQPNKLLQKIYNQLNSGETFLDLGCGQGRDSLFMLQKGFKVEAVDNSSVGINKIKESIQANNLPINNLQLFCDDIKNFNILKDRYGIINIFNSLQFLPPKEALKIIKEAKNKLKHEGYIIISGFTTNDPLYKKINPDERCFFKPQELKKIFSNFHLVEYQEKIIEDKGHSGSPKPHQHGIVEMIAQKISTD